jgi:hypothetical protein
MKCKRVLRTPGIGGRPAAFRLILVLSVAIKVAGPLRAFAAETLVEICHGYSCKYKSRLVLGPTDQRRFASILVAGRKSANAERAAIATAVRYFERRTYNVTGILDEPRSKVGASGVRGQMDCIDESRNTRSLLLYLEDRQLLRHHTVGRNASRGLLIDGRYFHSTAVIRDADGVKWAVDSWYAPMGGVPDILPLSEWMPRGFLSSGALD